jgi:hypothetical protein
MASSLAGCAFILNESVKKDLPLLGDRRKRRNVTFACQLRKSLTFRGNHPAQVGIVNPELDRNGPRRGRRDCLQRVERL